VLRREPLAWVAAPGLVRLSQAEARRWPSPGRLAFYGLARAGWQPALRRLAAWAA